MAAFNAAATHTPLASGLIAVALSGFGGVVPVFVASLVGFLIGQRIELIGNKMHRTDWRPLLPRTSYGSEGHDPLASNGD